ncbi:rhodanese-like domain-containing protein [Winogradskyella litorisediminis]|uniref:Rhodanese-like domain-containing protein n=1 Tax=Winogradskyella litorisediminis TaxID=1156618 RepID=A0ABW3N6K4_9FLAO
MKKLLIFIFVLTTTLSFSQESLDNLLNRFNDKSVPYVNVNELAMPKSNPIILDTREPIEYEVSHLKDAICVGYDKFDLKKVTETIPDKDQPIVVYCSLGIRSETIGKKLQKAGYNNVYNLYGGIFEWKNKGFEVYNSKEQQTDSIHTFSKTWSKWLRKGIKVAN